MPEKKLIIVESPTKAKTIRKFLGSDCTVVASNGHIRTLPKNDLCIDIKNGYKPKYIIDETKEKVIAQIKNEMKGASELILATDEDREGESISWHLVEVLKPTMKRRRMVFHEITKKAILEAFENGRDIDMNLVHAQEARRVLDRLYGYTISPVLWTKLSNKSLSAGRVQSPGLRLVVDRERTRLTFEKSEYWDLKATFTPTSRETFTATIESVDNRRVANGKDFDSETGKYNGSSRVVLLNKETAEELKQALKTSVFTVREVKEKSVTQRPAPPFITSTLQQEGNRKLHLSARDTMKIAQNLYEQGYITYMRTDNPALSQEGIRAAREAALGLYGPEFVPSDSRQYSAKSALAQEAHEAIRPSGEHFVAPENTGLSGRELALYTMIWKRTLASQMKNAQKLNTTVTIDATTEDGRCVVFTATGVRIQFPGFIRVYVEGSDDPDAAMEDKEMVLPPLAAGQVITSSNIESVAHQTKEPNRFTEASLVQSLEKLGIGRPSTYATIIDRLIEKKYVIRDNGNLVPTFIGLGVIQLLERYFADRIDYDFTSDMESSLDKIAQGQLDELSFLKSFYEGDTGLDKQVNDNKVKIVSKDVKRLEIPKISEENSIYLGPYGPYVKSSEGKFISVPKDWTPASVTNEKISALISGGLSGADKHSTGPTKIGETPEGLPLFYCTGRFGDYWQIGDRSQSKSIQRYKVPKDLIGQKELPADQVLRFFALPRTVGVTSSGDTITADIGRFGPYIKCGTEFRNIKDSDTIFSITEDQARALLDTPKEKSKSTRTKSSTPKTAPLIDFGDQDGKNLAIYHGRYGFYLKHGDKNISLPKPLQNDESACKALSKETAISFLK